jgi:hypothetical protein
MRIHRCFQTNVGPANQQPANLQQLELRWADLARRCRLKLRAKDVIISIFTLFRTNRLQRVGVLEMGTRPGLRCHFSKIPWNLPLRT